METNLITHNLDSDDGNQRSNQIQSLDQKDPSLRVKIEAEKREGEDFPDYTHHSSVFIKNNIVLFGGRAQNQNLNNLLNIYNLEARTWQQKELKGESSEIPKPRSGHTANAIGNFIYIISGQGVCKDKNIYKIDFDTQKCQIIGEILYPLTQHTADVHNQSICIYGGYSLVASKGISMLQKFNLLTNECEQIKPTGYQPEGRCGHKSIIFHDTLYVFGGWSNYKYFQNMFSINLSNNVSTKIDQHGLIPSPRRQFSFFAFEDQIYLFGGCSDDDGQYSDFYCFNVKSSTWKAQETQNDKCLLQRGWHSTIAVNQSSYKLKVYLVGGLEKWGSIQKNMNVITLSSNRIYWTLHYLDSTGIHYLPGLNLIQEIIQMFE